MLDRKTRRQWSFELLAVLLVLGLLFQRSACWIDLESNLTTILPTSNNVTSTCLLYHNQIMLVAIDGSSENVLVESSLATLDVSSMTLIYLVELPDLHCQSTLIAISQQSALLICECLVTTDPVCESYLIEVSVAPSGHMRTLRSLAFQPNTSFLVFSDFVALLQKMSVVLMLGRGTSGVQTVYFLQYTDWNLKIVSQIQKPDDTFCSAGAVDPNQSYLLLACKSNTKRNAWVVKYSLEQLLYPPVDQFMLNTSQEIYPFYLNIKDQGFFISENQSDGSLIYFGFNFGEKWNNDSAANFTDFNTTMLPQGQILFAMQQPFIPDATCLYVLGASNAKFQSAFILSQIKLSNSFKAPMYLLAQIKLKKVSHIMASEKYLLVSETQSFGTTVTRYLVDCRE